MLLRRNIVIYMNPNTSSNLDTLGGILAWEDYQYNHSISKMYRVAGRVVIGVSGRGGGLSFVGVSGRGIW